MDDAVEQPDRRERVGSRAWVRTVGLVGSGLVAGGIMAGTLTATAATDEGSTSTPSVTQEEAAAADSTTPGDCPQEGGTQGTAPDRSSSDDSATDPSA